MANYVWNVKKPIKVKHKFNVIFGKAKVKSKTGRHNTPRMTDAEIEEIRKKLGIKLPDKNPHGYSNGL